MKHTGPFDFSAFLLGQATVVRHTINTGDAAPVRSRPNDLSPPECPIILIEVSVMLERDILKPSSFLFYILKNKGKKEALERDIVSGHSITIKCYNDA